MKKVKRTYRSQQEYIQLYSWITYHGIYINLPDDPVMFLVIWTLEAIPEIYELQCQTLAESAGIRFQNKLVSTEAGSELGDSLALPSLQNTAFQGISGSKEIHQNKIKISFFLSNGLNIQHLHLKKTLQNPLYDI